MNKLSTTFISACIALSSASVFAQDTTTKKDGMTKDHMMSKDHMTAANCKDHMERNAKGEYKQDPASEKMTSMCQKMLKNSNSTSK